MKTAIVDIRPTHSKRDRWRQYEQQKAMLQRIELSPEEYQLAVRKLAEKLRL